MIYTLYVMLNLAGAIGASALAIFSLQNQHLRASKTFAFWMICAVLWTGGAGLSAISATAEQAVFWMYPVRYTGIMFATSAVVLFALDYTGNWHRLTKFHWLVLIGIPSITVLTVWIPNHPFFWQDLETIQIGAFWFTTNGTPGLAYWSYVFVGFILGTYALIILLHYVYSGLEYYRWRIIALIGGTSIPMLASLWVTIQFQIGIHIDVSASTIVITALLWGALIFRDQLLEMMPIAYDAVVKQIAEAVMIVDSNGRLVELNPVAIAFLKQSRNTIIGQPVTSVFKNYPDLLTYDSQPHNQPTQIEVQSDNDTTLYYDVRIAPLRDINEAAIGYLITLHDVTQRFLAEQARLALVTERQRIEVLHQFIGNVSHDLRTPLSVLVTSLYVLERRLDGQEAEYIERMQAQLNRLTQLIDDMFTMVKLDTSVSLKKRPYPVNAILRQSVASLEMRYQEAGHKFQLDLDDTLPPIWCDSQQLQHAFEQIITNAILYSEPETQITIRTFSRAEQLLVEVSDEGIGIAPDEQEKVFQHFYRMDTARGTSRGGTGLGLSITKRIIDLHGASIEINSQVGEGSTFRFIFPQTTWATDNTPSHQHSDKRDSAAD
ncbi:MAG: histidine kinase N-terminal 7TM domain-containing protein [Phototrophicaceae bacterium]